MATLSDLRAGLAQVVGAILYPSGIPSGSTLASPVVNCPVRIFQGSPEREAIDADMAAGIVDVSVASVPGGINTTRYPVVDIPVALTPASLGWSVAGATATLGGTVATPQNVGLLVDGQAFLYAVQPTDTLASVAAALAALIAAVQPAGAAGAMVTVPGSHSLIGRAGGFATTQREVGRERVTVQITIWAASEALRQAVGSAIEPGLRDLRRLPLAEGSIAMCWFGAATDADEAEKSSIYRRTLNVSAEYASIIIGTAAQILDFSENIVPNGPI
jgi:hypothetical protein